MASAAGYAGYDGAAISSRTSDAHLSFRQGQGRALAAPPVRKPLLPFNRVIGPLLQLNAPEGWLRVEEELFALRLREAAGDDDLSLVDQGLGSEKLRFGLPYPRGLVVGRRHDALPIRAERGAAQCLLMAHRKGHFFSDLGIPHSRSSIFGRGDNAPTIRAEGGAQHPIRVST